MSELLNEFRVFSKINPEIKKKIKIFHVFDNVYAYDAKNVFFITSDDNCDDQVFSFGYNNSGFCGLGGRSDRLEKEEIKIKEPQIIPELCGKYVQHFFAGLVFVLGLTKDNKVYGWGDNGRGQLAKPVKRNSDGTRDYLKPAIIDLPNVIQLSCGLDHTLALTCDGRVFGWGDNRWGQICGMCGKEEYIIKPIHLQSFKQFSVKLLKTSDYGSYALTVDGLVYKWGKYYRSFEEHCCEPILIANIPKMLMICPIGWFVYLLSNEGDIYKCDYKIKCREYLINNKERLRCEECSRIYEQYTGYLEICHHLKHEGLQNLQKPPKLLTTGIRFSSVISPQHADYHIFAVSDDRVLYEFSSEDMQKSVHKNYFEYYSIQYECTYKTIHLDKLNIGNDGNDLKDIQSYKVFDYMFKNLELLGRGGYGKVYRTKYNYNQEEFDIKLVSLKGKIVILTSLLELNFSF